MWRQTPLDAVSVWHMDEGAGSSFADAQGNSANCTLNQANNWVEGVRGAALYFDGTLAGACASSPRVPVGAAAFTVAAWVKPQSPAVCIVSWGSADFAQSNTFGMVYAAGVFEQFDNADGGNYVGGPNLATGSWTHLAASWDGTVRRLYINGSKVLENVPPSPPDVPRVDFFHVGADCNQPYPMFGALDELALWARALADDEVVAAFASGKALQAGAAENGGRRRANIAEWDGEARD